MGQIIAPIPFGGAKKFVLKKVCIEKHRWIISIWYISSYLTNILGTYFDRGMGYVLPHISRTRFFLDMRFLQNDGESSHPSICTIWTKSLELFLRKMTRNDKNPILTPFLPQNSRTRIFFENRAPSLFCIYGPLTSCKKSEKSLEPISVTLCHWQTDKLTNWLTDWLTWVKL